jgi:hypothetical protein
MTYNPLITSGIVLWFSGVLSAQVLNMQVQPSASGKDGLIFVHLANVAGKEPVALQWDFSFPESVQLDFMRAKVEDAAAKVHKSLRCQLLPNRQGKTQTCRCILSGGASPISTGPVASIKYAGARTFRPGKYDLQIKKSLAITADLQKVTMKDSGTEISVAK